MPKANSIRTHAAKTGASFALSLLMLTACGSTPEFQAPVQNVQRASNNIEAAICEGRAEQASEILSSEPLAGPVDQFYKALAHEKSGMAISARKLYAQVMQMGSQQAVFMRCGSEILANGTVSQEAGRRLATLAQELRAMDVMMTPPTRLHSGLPVRQTSGSTTPTSAPTTTFNIPTDVFRPKSTSPFGRWFAHLASYKSYQNALNNKGTLEKEFPALEGYIDQWEVSVAGGAVRLGVRLDDRDDANRLCRQVKSNGKYCAVLDTTPGG